MLLLGNVLNQRADRHNEKSAGESQACQKCQDCMKRQSVDRQTKPERRHRQRSERDQSVFDFSAGEISGSEASQPNPDGHRRLQQASMRRIEMEDILSIQKNIEL